jgi:TolA-binding protein
LFSFGVVLYEMSTGRQSFPGHTTAVVFDGILNRDPVPPSNINAQLPAELDRIVSKALEKDRSLRYQTAADIGADLKRLRRDSASRHGLPTASGVAAPSTSAGAMTVVMSDTAIGAPSGISSAPTTVMSGHSQIPPSKDASQVLRGAAKTPWVWGVGVGVVAIAAVAAGVGAFLANRDSAPPADQTAATTAPPATPPVDAAPASAPAPTPTAPADATPAPSTPPPAPAPAKSATPPTQTSTGAAAPGANVATAKATPKTAPPAAAPAAVPAPPATSRDTQAAQLLEVAKAKVANNLNEQALADLRQIIVDFPGSRAAAEAAFMAGEIHEKTGRIDDAMAAYVEFESRFGNDRRAADAKLRRSALLGRQRQAKSQALSLQLLNEVVRDYPGSPQSLTALQNKLRIETDDRDLRAIDPVTKQEGPAFIATLRTLIEQFPDGPQSLAARNRLAVVLSQANRHKEAADVLEELGAKNPEAPNDLYFRLGEIYERRLNDPVKAREAYAKVPAGSPRYNDAQKKLNRK